MSDGRPLRGEQPRGEEGSGLSYWKEQLRGLPEGLSLPTDFSRQAAQPDERAVRSVTLSSSLLEKLEALSREQDVTLFTTLLAGFELLLQRYSGQDDIVVGTPLAAAHASNPEEPGDILPLRTDVSGNPEFRVLLDRVHRGILEAQPHTGLSIVELLDGLELAAGPGRHPLFRVVFDHGTADSSADRGADLPGEIDLKLLVAKSDRGLETTFEYDTRLFQAATIDRMAGHYETLLQSIAGNPDQRLLAVPLITESERHQLVEEWNDTGVEFPHDRCLHHLFEANASARPDANAVIVGSETLTYAQLNERCNQLAHHLRSLGVGPDMRVGICVERSVEMVVGLMGIAKAGGAYVPLDPKYPEERLAMMLDDARVSVLLTLERLEDRFPDRALPVVRLDSEWETIARNASDNPEGGAGPENLAYVIYTSGSTGKPKGVVLDHRGRVNNFSDFNRRFSVGPDDRLIALSSLSFDMTAYDVFGILAAGATIVAPLAAEEREPGHWAELMVRHEVTVWHSAPAMLEMLVDHVEARSELRPRFLRLALLGGDWIPVTLPDRLKALAEGVQVISLGGATEASMDSTIYPIGQTDPAWRSIPYGRPMANQLAYVLDDYREPLPIGVPGELYLGGVGVAWGYLDRPELTAEKFVPNPFSGRPGDRIYRTGDLARTMPDGNLELLGRMDHQVKIRGHRIELGEIVATLRRHEGVQDAVVVAGQDDGQNTHLVAYVVPDDPQELARGESASWSETQAEQVSQWQKVYDETYGQTPEQDDPTFNIIGWNDSYTGLPIPDEEMREWVDTTVARIRAMRPTRVLELGVGTGLLLFQVAPQCERYWGLDLSDGAFEKIRRQLNAMGLETDVSLFQRTADNLEGFEENSFDGLVLNSVTQLFPSVDYLLQVLEGAVKVVEPGGFLFIGDVRSKALFEEFHTLVQMFQSPATTTREKLQTRIRKSMTQEEQLVIDPAFFFALRRHLPKIGNVLIQPRRGHHDNELTQFRYDVVLQLGAGEDLANDAERMEWQDGSTVPGLRRLLLEKEPAALAVTGVPNARVASAIRSFELVRDGDPSESLSDLRQALEATPPTAGVDPEQLWALEDDLPYSVHVGWPSSGGNGRYDVLFRRRETTDAAAARPAVPSFPADEGRSKPWSHYANHPLQGKLHRNLAPQLRSFLQQQLPDYMVPANFVLLDALPLSPNGKVDRRALPAPDHTRPELDEPYVAPRDPFEEVLAELWAEVLGLDRVGIRDNFLELGGHSLLATQIQSRILELFPVEVSLRHFFGSPTIDALARRLRSAGSKSGVDVVEIARLVMDSKDLSEHEIKAKLAKGGSPS